MPNIDVKQLIDLKRQGENLSIFVMNLLNPKENPLHELFKEDEPTSILEFCDELRNYALAVSFNFSNFPQMPDGKDKAIAGVIHELYEQAGTFIDKHAAGGNNKDLTANLQKLATFFVTNHLILDSYFKVLIDKLKEHPVEKASSKL